CAAARALLHKIAASCASCRRSSATAATSKPCTRWPASPRWRAIGTPITPRPMNPMVSGAEGCNSFIGQPPRFALWYEPLSEWPIGGSCERPPDQDLLHFARALVDLAHAHVAVDA